MVHANIFIVELLFLLVSAQCFLLPPSTSDETVTPICSSYESLCGMNYRYVTYSGVPIELMPSESEICTCSGNVTCNTDWKNKDNSIVQRLLTGSGQQLEAKISFCQLPKQPNNCTFGSAVLVTKGHGQFSFQLATPVMCRCNRPLVARASWRDGAYDYVQYGCGQSRCVKRNTIMCAQVKYLNTGDFAVQHFCRCRRDEVCTGELPTAMVSVTDHTCHKHRRPDMFGGHLHWTSFRT